MGNKNKPPAPVSTDASPDLTHSPFAALRALEVKPAPAQTSAANIPRTPVDAAAESGRSSAPAGTVRGRLILRRETKHRGGKAVVIVSGFATLAGFDAQSIAKLAKDCKQSLGCGGTVDGDEIVLQGDRPAEVAELLRNKGFRVSGVTS